MRWSSHQFLALLALWLCNDGSHGRLLGHKRANHGGTEGGHKEEEEPQKQLDNKPRKENKHHQGHKQKKPTDPVTNAETPQQVEPLGQEVEEEEEEETRTLDCASFLMRQTDSMVVYDDFEEIDPTETFVDGIKDMTCKDMSGGSALCVGGKEETALWVHGKCKRGVGTTTISFTSAVDDSEIVFACGGSPRAVPSVRCDRCRNFGDNKNKKSCDFPFRAEARFGILSIPSLSSGHCALHCKMPTTDE